VRRKTFRLSLTRFPADWIRGRTWALRHSLSAYDATYVALAEALSATSLLTTDARLAAAPGIQCVVDVV
jgi:predicted nucleic acid-binding protein